MIRHGLVAGLLLLAPCVLSAEMLCGKDLNGDSYVDAEGELIACVDEVCPHDLTDCNQASISCSDGATLDTARDKCQLPPAQNCPEGFTYESTLDKCLTDPLCPDGGSYSASAKMCVKPPVPSCKPPYQLNEADLCVAAGECTTGLLDAAKGRCEIEPTWVCPDNMTLTAELLCVTLPECKPPSIYSPTTNRCETPPVFDCPVGYQFNGSDCETSPDCGSGVLNPASNLCEAPVGDCPLGTTWNSTLKQCTAAAECSDPAAALNPATDRCETAATIDCPENTSWNGTQCVAQPECVAGTFDSVLSKCVIQAQSTCSTTDATFNPVTGLCESPLVCSGGTFNSTIDKCTASGSCPSPYTLSSGTCNANPTCPDARYVYTGGTTDMCLGGVSYQATANWMACTAKVTFAGKNYNVSVFKGFSTSVSFSTGSNTTVYFNNVCEIVRTTYYNVFAQPTTYNYGGTYPPFTILSSPTGNTGSKDRVRVGDVGRYGTATTGYIQIQNTSTPSGMSCPSGGLLVGNICERASNNVPPTCPLGGTYNSAVDKCRLSPCSQGTYDTSVSKCTWTPTCNGGGTFNPVTNNCQTPSTAICPQGATSTDVSSPSCITSPICPNNTTSDGAGHCTASPVCPNGSAFDQTTGNCLAASPPATTCPNAGYTLNSVTGKCEKAPTCSAGSYDPSLDVCIFSSSQPCTTPGFTYTNGQCENAPECPSNYTYDSTGNNCISNQQTCSTGYIYDANYAACIAEPICTQGTYSNSDDSCNYQLTVSFSGGRSVTGVFGGLLASGNKLSYMVCTSWDHESGQCISSSVVAQVNATNTTLTGEIRDTISNMTSSGNKIYFYSCTQTDSESGLCVAEAVSGTITASPGVTFSGGMEEGLFRTYLAMTGVVGSGNRLNFYFCTGYDTEGGCTQTAPVVITASGGSMTQVPASCPGTGSLNLTIDKCTVPPSFDSSPATCAAGQLNVSSDLCIEAAAPPCPVGTTYDGAGQCTAVASCPNGTLDPATNLCTQNPITSCPSGTIWDGSQCYWPPSCPSGTAIVGEYCQSTPGCPSGTTLVDGVCVSPPPCGSGTTLTCYATPQCPADTTLINGNCQHNAAKACPVGFALDGLTCYQAPQCSSGTFIPDQNLCFAGDRPCPQGFSITPTKDSCTNSPLCPPGGTFDGAVTDSCRGDVAYRCEPTDFSYDSTSGSCWDLPYCDQSQLNTSLDRCEAPASPDCGIRDWDPVEQVCHIPVVCSLFGNYSLANQQCEVPPWPDCGEWVLNLTSEQCEDPPQCPEVPGSPTGDTMAFDGALDKCTLESMQELCMPGYTYAPLPVDKCEKPIECAEGTYDPVTDSCPMAWNCPLGSQYACADIGGGTPQCSPFSCVDPATDTTPEQEPDTTTFVDDGEITNTGECLGQWKIFNGKAKECLPPGWSTTFFNCCDESEDSFLFIEKVCKKEAYDVALAKKAGRTHYVGSYCKKDIPLIGCVQKAKVYCVFNSKMGRIIQEGCRPQLLDFAPSGKWGPAKHPNCDGLSPEQFQSCDFGKIDFSEMTEEFTPNLDTVAPSIQGAIDGYMENLH